MNYDICWICSASILVWLRNAYENIFGNYEGEGKLGRSRRKWEKIIRWTRNEQGARTRTGFK
jgi:hypothetical protein